MGDVADLVTVVTGTFGDEHWIELAHDRARASVPDGVAWIHAHRDTLHDARNAALEGVQTPYTVHLDADDELGAGYLDAMSARLDELGAGAAGLPALVAPMVQYVTPDGRRRGARFPNVAGHVHDCTDGCLPDGNWLVVGTMVVTELARRVGGWRDFAWSEDWDLWLRCVAAGATIARAPAAVYIAHVRPDSRNRGPDRAFKLAAHDAIHRANFPHLYAEAAS